MVEINSSAAAERVIIALKSDFEMLCHRATSDQAGLVESEIELMVLATFDMIGRITKTKIAIGDVFPEDGSGHILVTPQFVWNKYRIDFCFRHCIDPNKLLFVECDGHDFHERTKEQAEHDRSKDRAIQLARISILRFTGREIWRDPGAVAIEIFNFMAR